MFSLFASSVGKKIRISLGHQEDRNDIISGRLLSAYSHPFPALHLLIESEKGSKKQGTRESILNMRNIFTLEAVEQRIGVSQAPDSISPTLLGILSRAKQAEVVIHSVHGKSITGVLHGMKIEAGVLVLGLQVYKGRAPLISVIWDQIVSIDLVPQNTTASSGVLHEQRPFSSDDENGGDGAGVAAKLIPPDDSGQMAATIPENGDEKERAS